MKTWLKGGLIGAVVGLIAPFTVWIPGLNVLAIPFIAFLSIIEYIINLFFNKSISLANFQYLNNPFPFINCIILGFFVGSLVGWIVQKIKTRGDK